MTTQITPDMMVSYKGLAKIAETEPATARDVAKLYPASLLSPSEPWSPDTVTKEGCRFLPAIWAGLVMSSQMCRPTPRHKAPQLSMRQSEKLATHAITWLEDHLADNPSREWRMYAPDWELRVAWIHRHMAFQVRTFPFDGYDTCRASIRADRVKTGRVRRDEWWVGCPKLPKFRCPPKLIGYTLELPLSLLIARFLKHELGRNAACRRDDT
jgi:hypothetical protein